MKRIKTGGRQKGTPNKITSEIRDKIQVLISGTIDSLDISKFTHLEKIKLLQVLCHYILPKLQSADYQIGTLDMPSQVSIRFIDNNGVDISDQHKDEIEQIRTLDETDRGLRADMHNLLRGDESKIVIG